MHTVVCSESRKNAPLRCSIFFIWRSGLTQGAGTKNGNSTSPPPLLLCCCWCAAAAVLLCCCCCAAVLLLLCCCAAAAVLLLLLLQDPRFIAAPRSAMLIRDAYTEIPEKKNPLRCSISFIWRSGLPRDAGTKNSNFTLPQRVEEL